MVKTLVVHNKPMTTACCCRCCGSGFNMIVRAPLTSLVLGILLMLIAITTAIGSMAYMARDPIRYSLVDADLDIKTTAAPRMESWTSMLSN
ncbi:hypothetical protein TCAL_17381 [Tigriopus californicus]|uniref:Uncharacterized protein n=1 Tax=Tigriopus californicus TaxID=6832 RepID=A0A553P4H2_TIGCA|nr:hypothetical protein TCAL_17381 [Tigriopus californicus]